MFFDFDGTLAPIAGTPDKAFIPKITKELLGKLSRAPGCKIVVISGRKIKDLKNKIKVKGIVYSGNHGFEISGGGLKRKIPLSRKYKKVLGKIRNDVERNLSKIKGILLEDKKYSLSIHYRLVNKKHIPLVKNIISDIASGYQVKNEIKLRCGKKVFEIVPPIEWDKGKAVSWILKKQGYFLKNKTILPFYFGDDNTDEDAFDALKDKGITVFIGDPGFSKAEYYLKNTVEVRKILKHILETMRNK
ncbi:MAG: trehalose-phosphatase [bacterium]